MDILVLSQSKNYTDEELAKFSANNVTLVKDWLSGTKYVKAQIVAYMGKLYRLKNEVALAIISPDIDPTNYEVYSGSGGSGSNSIKFPDFSPNNIYSYKETIVHDNNLLMAKNSFISATTFDINDWDVVSDMHKTVYDVNGNAIVDKAEHALVADMAIETQLVQTWKPNTNYTVGQNLVYNYETYEVTTNFTSGLAFNDTNLILSATGNHNNMDSLQGGDSVQHDYYHITKNQHDVMDRIVDSNGSLSYNSVVLGDMKKSIYDANGDGIVDKASTLDGLTATITELSLMHGATGNVQAQINALASVGNFTGSVNTFADVAITFTNPKNKDMCIVIADETKGGISTIYFYSGTAWVYSGKFTVQIRDFTVNPLNEVTESVGLYLEPRIDPLIARKTDVPNIPNAILVATYTQSEADLADAVAKKHEHANKALLDTYTQTNTDIANAISKMHTHANQAVINNFSQDALGNPLYNGNPLGTGSGGGSGISNLSMFNTTDLVDSANHRYVTDLEKASLQNLSAIVLTQTTMNNTLTTISNEIPSNVSSTNKLTSNSDVDTKINNVKFINLADVDHVVKPSAFLVTNATGTQVTYLSSIKSMIKIQKVTDKDGIAFTDVPNLTFKNLSGVQDLNGNLELTLEDMFTTNLKDMPATYDNGKVLVANSSLMKYELKDVGALTNSHENYTKTIGQTDWYHDTTLGIYTYVVNHSLGSQNLVIGLCDAFNNSVNNITWQIIDNNSVMFKATTDDAIRVVINCSQGVAGSGTGSTTGVSTITASDFLDDLHVRTDKTYSSSKIASTLANYAQKATVYTKTESTSIFSAKINEHIHTNMSTLNKISEDGAGNMYFGGQKILTNLQPFTHQDHWDNKNYSTSSLIVDVNNIFNTNSYSAILNSEFTIKNNIVSVDETTDALSANQLHVVVIDNSIVVLDVLIPPASVQKYILGVSPNVQIMVQGQFSGNYYLTAY